MSTEAKEGLSNKEGPHASTGALPKKSASATEQKQITEALDVGANPNGLKTPKSGKSSYETPTAIPAIDAGAAHAGKTENRSDDSESYASNTFAPWTQTFVLDLLDKQYRLYSWTDAKALSLITTNSLLLAAIGFLFKECLQDKLATCLIGIGLVLNAFSLFYSLFQVIPQGSSGKGGARVNLRALSGILTFQDWQSYESTFRKYSLDEAVSDTLRQAYGMAHNTDKGRKSITRGVRLTLASLVFVVLSAFAVAGTSAGINLLGKWSKIEALEKDLAQVEVQRGKAEISKIVEKSSNATVAPHPFKHME